MNNEEHSQSVTVIRSQQTEIDPVIELDGILSQIYEILEELQRYEIMRDLDTQNNESQLEQTEADENLQTPFLERENIDKKNENNNLIKSDQSFQNTSIVTVKKIWKYRDRFIMLKVLAMFLYIADVFSDIILALEYLIQKQYFYAILTSIFVWIPSMFITYMSERRKSNLKLNTYKNIFICQLLVLFCWEPVLCYIQILIYAIKFQEASKVQKKEIHIKLRKIIEDTSFSKLLEGCMEAVPQIILQLLIVLWKYDDMKYDLSFLLQITSLIFSFGGLIITFNTYFQEDNEDLKEVDIYLRLAFVMKCLFILASRILSIAVSASIYLEYTAIVLTIHWIGTTTWNYYDKIQNIIECTVMGIIDTFFPMFENTKFRRLLLSIFTVENITMITIWAIFSGDKIRNSCVYIPFLILNITTLVLGGVLLIIFEYNIYKKKKRKKTVMI